MREAVAEEARVGGAWVLATGGGFEAGKGNDDGFDDAQVPDCQCQVGSQPGNVSIWNGYLVIFIYIYKKNVFFFFYLATCYTHSVHLSMTGDWC